MFKFSKCTKLKKCPKIIKEHSLKIITNVHTSNQETHSLPFID